MRTPDERLPGDIDLAERAAVADPPAWAAQRIDLGPQFDGLHAGYAAYEQDLHFLGLTDAQVASRYTWRTFRGSVAWSLAKVAVATPFTLIGIIVHVIPFPIVKQLAKRPRNEGIKATVKLLGCFTLFLLTYTVIGVLVGTHWGAWLGLVAAVVAPLCGYLAVRLFERVKHVGGLLEGYRTMRGASDPPRLGLRPPPPRRGIGARPRGAGVRRTALRYGSQHAQLAHLWWPDGPQGDLPVVTLIHGGFWRQIYTKRLMDPLAKALVAQGGPSATSSIGGSASVEVAAGRRPSTTSPRP